MVSTRSLASVMLATQLSACLASDGATDEAVSQLQPSARAWLRNNQDTPDGANLTNDELSASLFQTKDESRCNIFTLWEYTDTPPLGQMMVVEGWRRHSDGLCNEPVLIDDANVKQWIPDMPDEYFKLPYSAARSDMIRYGAIYHHGGLYMDTDLLLVEDMGAIIDLLKDHELVSYTSKGPDEKSTCQNQFSSNFLGAPKGSSVLKAIWEQQKAALQNHCKLEDKEKEVVCCFDEDVECHIPWAGLGERISHKVTAKDNLNELTHCFSGKRSFVPAGMEEVLMSNLDLDEAASKFLEYGEFGNDSLTRKAYHLFSSNSGLSHMTCEDLQREKSFVGQLQRQSFATGKGWHALSSERSAATKAWLRRYPYFRPLSDAAFDGQLPCRVEA